MPTRISATVLEQIRAKLAALPPKPKADYSGREAIAKIKTDIHHAMSLGYTITEIAAMMKEEGLHLGAGTASSYLRELEPKPDTRKQSTKPKAVSAAKPALDRIRTTAAPPPHDTQPPLVNASIQAEIELDQLLDTISPPTMR